MIHLKNIRISPEAWARIYDAAKVTLDAANARPHWSGTVKIGPRPDGLRAPREVVASVDAILRPDGDTPYRRMVGVKVAFYADGTTSAVVATFKMGAAQTEQAAPGESIEATFRRAECLAE